MIGNNLKWCREELEMTQAELGSVIGVSKYTIHGWENSHDTIPFHRLLNFCNIYNYSLDFVCGLTRTNTKYGTFKTDKKAIGKKLKELREELNINQQELANKCNISQGMYSYYEKGKYIISTTVAYSICKTYNISMDYLVGRTNNIKLNQ